MRSPAKILVDSWKREPTESPSPHQTLNTLRERLIHRVAQEVDQNSKNLRITEFDRKARAMPLEVVMLHVPKEGKMKGSEWRGLYTIIDRPTC